MGIVCYLLFVGFADVVGVSALTGVLHISLFVCPIDEGDTLVVGMVGEGGGFVKRVVGDGIAIAVGGVAHCIIAVGSTACSR